MRRHPFDALFLDTIGIAANSLFPFASETSMYVEWFTEYLQNGGFTFQSSHWRVSVAAISLRLECLNFGVSSRKLSQEI